MMQEITIRIEKIELETLIREYKAKGLGMKVPGNNPSPRDMVTKKIVEAAKK